MRMPAMFLALPLLMGAPRFCAAAETALVSEQGQRSYSIGYQVGGDFRRQGLEIRLPSLVKGLTDALQGSEPALSETEMRAALRELQTIVSDKRRE